MNESTENEVTTNVIELKFNAKVKEEIPHDIAHPASMYYPEELDDDPLYDLLHEFDDVIEEDFKLPKQKDYIFHLVGAEDIKLKMSQTTKEMGELVSKQTARLREDVKRMKFYLDEMNIDD